jgi:hypothetical protein
LYYKNTINECVKYNSSQKKYKEYNNSDSYINTKSLLYLYENKIATKYYTYFSLLIIIIDILTLKKNPPKKCLPDKLITEEYYNLNKLVNNELFLYELEEFEIIIKNFYNLSCSLFNTNEISYKQSIEGLPCLDYFNNAMAALI